LQSQNTEADRRVLPSAPSSDKKRHMDVYPSRNVDIREHRVPAMHNKLITCGDRLRSAGVFLD